MVRPFPFRLFGLVSIHAPREGSDLLNAAKVPQMDR